MFLLLNEAVFVSLAQILKPILGGASARVFGRTKITVKIVEALARV